ncbi:hypothetical protein Ae201684P_009484 [Aphanomyces euteiches]|uniref:F-box domain-containing protein n=1 Tax=Aphanomyces euteiches TaxID=100861 RepID=A0A6G0WL05_9STRA|nr:hypothetical protein Ae201684_014066 [Aphanomyces euteiches]KAH9096249.1 hypothetical protein Ae201684P_009484 [Aphanomyces euteiches]
MADSNVRRLPEEVVTLVALFVRDANTVFAFLEALRPANLLGPLEPLWQLGLVKSRTDLWPDLDIRHDDENLTEESQLHLLSAMKFYDRVFIYGRPNFPWTLANFKKNVEFWWSEWNIDPDFETSWIAQISERVVALYLPNMLEKNETNMLLDQFPRFTNLRSLELYLDEPWYLKDLFDFLADESQITDLVLRHRGTADILDIEVTDSTAESIIRWIENLYVEVFQFSRWNIQIENDDLRDYFFDTIFSSDSLRTLVCDESNLSGIDFASFSYPMDYLELHVCDLSQLDIQNLAIGLKDSNVRDFMISYISTEEFIGFRDLLRGLNETSITKLQLSQCNFRDEHWVQLARCLKTCVLTSLSVCSTGWSRRSVISIANAIKSNNSIEHLALDDEPVGFIGIVLLIKSGTSPERAVQLRSIDVVNCGLRRKEVLAIQKFAHECGVKIKLNR